MTSGKRKSLTRARLFATPWTIWNSPGQNTRVGSLSLLQEIFPTQELNPGLPHCGQILYQLSHKGHLKIQEWVAYPFSRGSSQPRNCTRIMEKAREFQKNLYFCFIDHAKAFDCVDHNKLGKILKEMGIPDHLICLLRNLYAGQEATARTGHGTTDWFQIGKGVHQGCILSPAYLTYM